MVGKKLDELPPKRIHPTEPHRSPSMRVAPQTEPWRLIERAQLDASAGGGYFFFPFSQSFSHFRASASAAARFLLTEDKPGGEGLGVGPVAPGHLAVAGGGGGVVGVVPGGEGGASVAFEESASRSAQA
jgi:hypothetical protein